MPVFEWLLLNNLGFKTLGQIQNLAPHRLMSRLISKSTLGDTLSFNRLCSGYGLRGHPLVWQSLEAILSRFVD